jgi:large subunit ribosomal protein L13
MKKTTLVQNVKNDQRQWFVVDAAGKRLGQLSVIIANCLRGKNQAGFTPHSDMGSYVVVLNAEKIELSGNKEEDKMYYRHSGYLGHLKSRSVGVQRQRNPRKILESSVSGMLPKTKLRSAQMKRLVLVIGENNPHEAQKPQPLVIK